MHTQELLYSCGGGQERCEDERYLCDCKTADIEEANTARIQWLL